MGMAKHYIYYNKGSVVSVQGYCAFFLTNILWEKERT